MQARRLSKANEKSMEQIVNQMRKEFNGTMMGNAFEASESDMLKILFNMESKMGHLLIEK